MAGGWFRQCGRASSRLLNAVVGGDGATTFSAQSWWLAEKGSAWGRLRTRFVDSLYPGEPNHCMNAALWHIERGILGSPHAPAKVHVVPSPEMAPPPPRGA